MTINQMASMNFAYRNMYINQVMANKASRSLASGYRINSAADDAAGLAVSEKMRGQIGGLGKAYENAQAANSLVRTAEGALQDTNDILTRMKDLATQASNGTYSDSDRALIDKEFQSLKGELDRIAGATNYNGMNLLDGSFGSVEGAQGVANMGITGIDADALGTDSGDLSMSIADMGNGTWEITAEFNGESITQQVSAGDTSAQFSFANNTIDINFGSVSDLKEGTITGVDVTAGSAATNLSGAVSTSAVDMQVGANAGETMGIRINDMSSSALGLDGVNVLSSQNALDALASLESATNQVTSERASLGAYENRLGYTMSNLANSRENLIASESTIRDTDMAKTMMDYMQRRIQMQASQAMMAQGMNLSQQMMLGILMR